jgi:Polyketide cyclase / dehydrase and lipid transport
MGESRAMSEARQQVLIDAPPRVVWDLIADVNRHPEWWPDIVEVECDDFHKGCSYREVKKVPFGTDELDLVVEEADECRRFRINCVKTGSFLELGLTAAQDGTFVDATAGINPVGLQYRIFDVLAGRRYFSKWLLRSLEAMQEVASNRALEEAGQRQD